MNVVIISKEKYEEMVGKLNLLSDRVNEIIGRRERGKLTAGWTTRMSASSCASAPAPCRRSATTGRWLTPR